jgi:hypothetical protein
MALHITSNKLMLATTTFLNILKISNLVAPSKFVPFPPRHLCCLRIQLYYTFLKNNDGSVLFPPRLLLLGNQLDDAFLKNNDSSTGWNGLWKERPYALDDDSDGQNLWK